MENSPKICILSCKEAGLGGSALLCQIPPQRVSRGRGLPLNWRISATRRRMRLKLIGFWSLAREERYRAIAAFVFVQMAFNFDGPEKWAIYQDLIASCQALSRISDLPFEWRKVSFAGKPGTA